MFHGEPFTASIILLRKALDSTSPRVTAAAAAVAAAAG